MNIIRLIASAFKKKENKFKSIANFRTLPNTLKIIFDIGFLFFIGLFLSFISLRLSYGYETVDKFTSNLDILFVVDTTLSMGVEDMNGQNRLESVKQQLGNFLDAETGHRYGLISFTHKVFVESPLSFDNQTVHTGLDSLLIIDAFYARGSSIGPALLKASELLSPEGDQLAQSRKKVIVLVTDGEEIGEAEINSLPVAKNIASKGDIKIVTVGVGTKAGGKIPTYENTTTGETYYEYAENGHAISRLDENNLQNIAQTGGGTYISIDEMKRLEREINNLSISYNNTDGENTTIHKDTYFLFAILLFFIIIIYQFRPYYFSKIIHKQK